eukprot:COSAG01_NODE_7845_length_3028_cov_8.342438_2_plen_165_part_00
MRRATWYLPGQSLPSRSGVGKRMNIMGAIVYWREMDANLGKYVLRCEVLRDVLHMWNGSTKDQETGERKAQPTAEPNDLVPEQLFTTAPFMRLRVVYRYYTLLAYGPTSMYRRSTGDYIPISMDRYVEEYTAKHYDRLFTIATGIVVLNLLLLSGCELLQLANA